MKYIPASLALLLGLAAVSTLGACAEVEVSENASAGDGLDTSDSGAEVGSTEARVCASGSTVKGIDVSFYQGSIDWARVRGAGIGFAFIRVSDGLSYPDDKFAANWAGAAAAGVPRGAYQFFRPNQDATAQADLLISRVGSLRAGDLPPVIDVEAAGGLSGSAIASRIRVWIDRVEAKLGVRPIVYTGKYFWQDNVGSGAFTSYPLWVAQYTSQCPDLPSPWTRWTFWQYSDRGSVAGVSGGVDVNLFNGSAADLAALSVGGNTPIEVYWSRRADGGYDLRALAPSEIVRVEYLVDGYAIGSATRADGDNFPTSYAFTSAGTGRRFEVRGYDADGKAAGRGVGSIDITPDTAVYIRQLGGGLYEIGLERAPSGVAAIEVRADGYLLTDGVSGKSRSTRLGVRSTFSQLGARTFAVTTFDASGAVRGTITREFRLE